MVLHSVTRDALVGMLAAFCERADIEADLGQDTMTVQELVGGFRAFRHVQACATMLQGFIELAIYVERIGKTQMGHKLLVRTIQDCRQFKYPGIVALTCLGRTALDRGFDAARLHPQRQLNVGGGRSIFDLIKQLDGSMEMAKSLLDGGSHCRTLARRRPVFDRPLGITCLSPVMSDEFRHSDPQSPDAMHTKCWRYACGVAGACSAACFDRPHPEATRV